MLHPLHGLLTFTMLSREQYICLGTARVGLICLAKGMRGRQLLLGWHFDQWEFWEFLSLLCEESRGTWLQSGAVAGVEERLRLVRGWLLRIWSQMDSACPWSN